MIEWALAMYLNFLCLFCVSRRFLVKSSAENLASLLKYLLGNGGMKQFNDLVLFYSCSSKLFSHF